MAKPTIKVTVNREGDATVSVDGVKGTKCKDLTAQIEKAIGATTSTALTDDYSKREESSHNLSN